MKIILISIILLFQTSLTFATNYHVTPTGAGSFTGLDEANAWKGIVDSLYSDSEGTNWRILGAGDTVFIHAGVYYHQNVGSYQELGDPWFASAINCNGTVFTPYGDGTVYFVKTSNGSTAFSVRLRSDFKFIGDTTGGGNFIITDSSSAPTSSLCYFGETDNGDLDSLQTYEELVLYHPNSICANMATKISILNCVVISEGSSASDVDVFTANYGRAGHRVMGCRIYNNNDNVGTDSHRDIFQISNIGLGEDLGGVYATERLNFIFANNLIYLGGAEGTAWNGVMYSSGPYCNQSFYIYGNVVVSEKYQTSMSAIWIGHGNVAPFNSYVQSLYILNNTFIVKGAGYSTGTHTAANSGTVLTDGSASWITDRMITLRADNLTDDSYGYITDNTTTTATVSLTDGSPADATWQTNDTYELDNSAVLITGYNNDTMIVKNNLMIIDTTSSKILNLDGTDGFPGCYKVYDYNYYGLYDQTPAQAFAVDNGVNITFANWQQSPYFDDVNSTLDSNDVTFSNKYGESWEDYYTVTGRDGGEDLSSYSWLPSFTTDALGNERPSGGDWDIGALEYQGTAATTKKVRVIIIK